MMHKSARSAPVAGLHRAVPAPYVADESDVSVVADVADVPDGSDVPGRSALRVCLARSPAEIDQALRLRYAVFAQEMGAKLHRARLGMDCDEFDALCDHLLVRDEDSNKVVGTYRILPPHRHAQIGRLYADAEFDLSGLEHLRPSLVEVGRSCVHPNYRSGPAILLLWAGLARYMRDGGYRHLIGCASVSLADGGAQAAGLRDRLQAHLIDARQRARPRVAFAHEGIGRGALPELPPLIKGYLRLGAKVCAEPAWDADFNCADFLIWLALQDMEPRYARHFDLLAARAQARPRIDPSVAAALGGHRRRALQHVR
jgi:putative hemolysin